MAALTFDPSALSAVVRHVGGAYTPPAVRGAAGRPQTATRQLTAGGGFGGVATLTKIGAAAWLTIPATCANGVAFDVEIDASALAAGNYSEIVRCSKGGWTDVDCVLALAVRGEGMPP